MNSSLYNDDIIYVLKSVEDIVTVRIYNVFMYQHPASIKAINTRNDASSDSIYKKMSKQKEYSILQEGKTKKNANA